MSRAKKMPQCAGKFQAGKENRIVYESLYCDAVGWIKVKFAHSKAKQNVYLKYPLRYLRLHSFGLASGGPLS